MRRGEIRLVDLEPVRGAEADKRRPAVIISNDSDLKEPISLVRSHFGKKVVLLGPKTTRISGALRPLAGYVRQFGPGALAKTQFPAQMQDGIGAFHKPQGW